MAKNNIYTIYKCTNTINGKIYIGYDSAWPRRRNSHLTKSRTSCQEYKSPFQNALRKHGEKSFEWEVIYQSLDQNHTLTVMEEYFITLYRSFIGFADCNGYNLTMGGEGQKSRPMSNETRHKKSVALKGKPSKQSKPLHTPFGTFCGVSVASEATGIPKRTIVTRIQSKNFNEWFYVEHNKDNKSLNEIGRGYTKSIHTPHGTFRSYRDCSIHLKLAQSTIRDRCNSPEFKDWCVGESNINPQAIKIQTPFGTFPSAAEAARCLKMPKSTIFANLRSPHKQDWIKL